MTNECIHMDRLAFAMGGTDKEAIGEALYWAKKLSHRAHEIQSIKQAWPISKSVQNDPPYKNVKMT